MTDEIVETTKAFQRDWEKFHAGRQPSGPLLRSDKDLPWVRFHSLPNSKRCPESDSERAIILRRANLLGELLLGPVDCWLVSTNPSCQGAAWAYGGQIEYDLGTVDEFIVPYLVQATSWRSGKFDVCLTAIAEDDDRCVWVSRKDGSVFAPYDGGFDLFAVSPDRIATIRQKWPEWLSSEPTGL